MSMLVGVRGQSRESEGAVLREGIIQQPGPFYNGNPSSIIWGNTPTAPLWKDESASTLSSPASTGFGNSQQLVQKEEKEKNVARMVAGEAKTFSRGRRHGSRTQFARYPNPTSSPAPPFAFGFPPQPPPGTSSSSLSRFGQFRTPSVYLPGSAFVAFGSGINYDLAATGSGMDTSGARPGRSVTPQDERMEDIEEVIPAMANLAVNYQPIDPKFSLNVDDKLFSSYVAENVSSQRAGSDLTRAFSASRPTNAADTSSNRMDASGVFVFVAKPACKLSTSPELTPAAVQQPAPSAPPRSRTLKVKRIVSAGRGKGAAAGNGAFCAPFIHSLHEEGSQSVGGRCSFLQPTLGAPLVRSAECSCDESSSHGFASSASMGIPANVALFPEEIHHLLPEVISPTDSECGNIFLSEIARGSNSSGKPNVRSNLPNVADLFSKTSELSQASLASQNKLLPSPFTRVSSGDGRKGENLSPAQSVALSLSGLIVSDKRGERVSAKREFASGNLDVECQRLCVEDLNSVFAHKLGLGSVGSHSDEEDVGKSGRPSNADAVEPSQNVDPKNGESDDVKDSTATIDAENLRSSSSSPIMTADVLRKEIEPRIDVQKPTFHAFTHAQAEPFTTHVRSEHFVFGASGPQPTLTVPSASDRFAAKACPSSLSLSFDTGGGITSRTASMSLTDLLGSKHTASDAIESSALSQDEADAVTSTFLSLNLGAAKSSVTADMNLLASTTPLPSSMNVKNDSDAGSFSYITAASRFIFSAGSSSFTSSQASVSANSAAKGMGGSGNVCAGENKVNLKSFPANSDSHPDYFDAQLMSQASRTSTTSFEFCASGGDSGGTVKSHVRKKSYKTQLSTSRRHGRTASSKETDASQPFVNVVDVIGTPDEAGSPMDFSPQRYTPPDDTIIPDTAENAKEATWTRNESIEKEGPDGTDEWAQYSEADLPMENLRDGVGDLYVGSKHMGRTSWEGIGKGEDDAFWWGGKENTPGKFIGRGKWKRSGFDDCQVPFSGRDNTWADVKIGPANEPEIAASSSSPSVDSIASSSGWGHFTFTAGSFANFPSTNSSLRRHARRTQKEKPASGLTDALKSANPMVEPALLAPAGGSQRGGGNTGSMDDPTSMKRSVFQFDARASHHLGNSKDMYNGVAGSWPRDEPKAATVVFSSRSNSRSAAQLSSLGSLPLSDGLVPHNPQTTGAAATEQVCEGWRLRGNQAYANGDFPKAEECYSRGASSVPPNETSQSCIRASMLCYSNRAATRMVVGRMREALADCTLAMAVDPTFLRVRLRAASCHLALGESDLAMLLFKECILRAKEDDQPDAKVSSEAAEGLRKALQVDEYIVLASEILAHWTSGDTSAALRLINEVLSSSPHSERALQLKCRALLLLRRYDEVGQLCDQSLITAERNHPHASADLNMHQVLQGTSGFDTATQQCAVSPVKLWRWQVSAKAKYHVGRLEESLEILQKLEEEGSVFLAEKASSTGCPPNPDPVGLSIASIRDLLRHKAAGNEAFQNGKHAEAVEHYSAALACNGDSRPFNAVCFCNRAAASQALGNIGDAIADCSRAIALDPKYAKAISRRATLHEKVRDYGQSCHDLQRLVIFMEGQQHQVRATPSPGKVGRVSTNAHQDLRQARDRLDKAEDEMKKGHPLDHYMILGLEPGCSSNDIKKAYRKAALRHHPDKAGQFLLRSEGGDDSGLWKEVGDEVRRDAERLFKLIGEANAILSDSQKRSRYDAEEDFRKLRTRTSTATAGVSEVYRSTERGQGGAGRRPRDRWDTWSGYNHQNQRWQSGPDAAQPDTYARRGRYGSNNSSRTNGDGGRWTDYDWDDI